MRLTEETSMRLTGEDPEGLVYGGHVCCVRVPTGNAPRCCWLHDSQVGAPSVTQQVYIMVHHCKVYMCTLWYITIMFTCVHYGKSL